MPPRKWTFRIEDIIEAIEKGQRYTKGTSKTTFGADEIVVDAVLRNLTIIGEAARFIPAEIEQRYPEIPWHKMRGLRNVIIHEYFGLSLEIIWETVQHNLPPLVPLLRRILEDENSETI